MERAAFEATEVLEEDCHERGDIFRCLIRSALRSSSGYSWRLSRGVTHNILSVVCVREAYADGLVDEEDIGILVPGVRVEGDVVYILDPTRT